MTKEEQIRQLQKEIMEERKDMPCGKQRDVVLSINHGLDVYTIGLVQQIEAAVAEALSHVGFQRSISAHGDIHEYEYWQFGACHRKEGGE